MSMLSAQCDKLRELATRYDELQVGAVKAVTMPSDMGSVLREAADTIWQLRDDLQRANAENAKLRELVEDMHAALQAFCDAQDVHGDNCPLWVERTDDCELRGIERRMRELGIEVES